MRQRKLTKEAREKITQIMRDRGEMTTVEAIELLQEIEVQAKQYIAERTKLQIINVTNTKKNGGTAE